MKTLNIFLVLPFIIGITNAQTITLLNEDFNSTTSGIPNGWTQWGTGGSCIQWETSQDVDFTGYVAIPVSNSQCFQETGWIQTPFVDLTQVSSPTLEFGIGISDFAGEPLSTMVSLWYDIGNGWVYLTEYGQAGSGASNTINGFNTFMSTVSDTVIYDLSALGSENNVRFSWGFEHAVSSPAPTCIDNVLISGQTITTGIKDESSKYDLDLRVSPNPSNGIFVVSFINAAAPSNVVIYESTGKQIMHETSETELMINLSNHAKGVYFLTAECEGQVKIKKLIIR